ncbi:hypothetical protein DRN97_08360 [Methanosarcinales archaeon]|nr:MAG: hypothetical protein DRN97_08360 [Methanosarcinales archaeon]
MTEYKIRVLRDAVKDAVERLPEDMLKEVYDFVSFSPGEGGWQGRGGKGIRPEERPYPGVHRYSISRTICTQDRRNTLR